MRVVEAGSFSRAARDGYVSTQSVAQQIDRLEREVGVPLLARDAHGVHPTEAGRAFYEGIGDIDRSLRALLGRCRSLANPESDLIRAGSSPSYSLGLFGKFIPDFLRMHPDVDIDYVDVGDDRDAELLSGVYDVVETIVPDDIEAELARGIAFEPLMRSRRNCYVTLRNPLARKSLVEPEDLRGMLICVFSFRWTENLRSFLDARCAGLEYREVPPTTQQFAEMMAGSDSVVCLFPEQLASRYPELVTVPLDAPVETTYGLLFLEENRERLAGLIAAAHSAFPDGHA
jgi:DNA-binding transcriptional LysR family regulator